jgi:hypothetical protein
LVAPSFDSKEIDMQGHESIFFEDFSLSQHFISTSLIPPGEYTTRIYDPLSWSNTNLPNDLQSFQSTSPNLGFDMKFPNSKALMYSKTCTSISTYVMNENLFCRHTCIAINTNICGGGDGYQGVNRRIKRQNEPNSSK